MSIEAVYNAVLEGNAPQAESATRAALAAGGNPDTILKEGCIAAMAEVGRQFEEGEMFVPEMLVAARAMQRSMAVLKPLLASAGSPMQGKAVVGTVKGDLHDIGKNLVTMMLEGQGFEVIDLGTDVSPAKFVEAVQTHRPQFVCMSALLTTTMPSMTATVEALKEAGVRDQVKVMIGGAPVTAGFAEKIGADGYAPDASSATRKAKELAGNS